MKYYVVVAKCGHVGNGKYIDVEFPICSNSASEAAKVVLKRRKVKKHLKNAITSVKEITELEYNNLVKNNPFKIYLTAHTSREFDLYDYDVKNLVFEDKTKKQEFSSRRERVSYILKKYKLDLKMKTGGECYDY